MAIIPYQWLFCPCPCFRAPLVQLFVMYCSESVPLCNMYNPVFHAVLQELTWLPQEDLIYLPISMLTSQEKKAQDARYLSSPTKLELKILLTLLIIYDEEYTYMSAPQIQANYPLQR